MTNFTPPAVLPSAAAEALREYAPLLRQLLYVRGITTPEAAESFLNPSYDGHLHDPFLLHDMDAAIDRILQAMENTERIAIYSDYDCDGIPGAVVLHDFFTAIGYVHFRNYIPHRHYEGFGFNSRAVDTLKEDGVSLIITIDCGTSDHEAVAYARECGIDVIITDHHEPKETLPDAVAVVNPKVGDTYPFSGLCGSGVAYKLVQACIARNEKKACFTVKPGWEKWSLDMVGLATIADMVPLTGENRALAHYGLQVLRKTRRPGLQQLLFKQRVDLRYLTEDDVGFTIGPRINAASRMDTPEDAFNMLATQNEGEAGAYVAHLEKLNNERRGVVASMTKEIHKRMEQIEELPSVLVFGNPQWRPSLVGLVASKLAETYNKPAFLWGRDGNGNIKGSCRSNGRTSVVTLMEGAASVFKEYGGHHMSGGFAVHEEHIHTFGAALNDAFIQMGEMASFTEQMTVDAAVSLDEIDEAFLRHQSRMAPFGMGNPKPVYVFKSVAPTQVSVFGKTKEHTKLAFDTKGRAREGIAFFTLPHAFSVLPKEGAPVDIYAHVEQSYFMGRMQTRLRIIDILSPSD